MSGKAVQVAVRVRPFNTREKLMEGGPKIGLDMSDATVTYWGLDNLDPEDWTVVTHEGKERNRTFDHCLWTHNANEKEPDREEDRPFAGQPQVFARIGQPLFDLFWGPNGDGDGGFNVCLFAYGQSGSGKSYSMTGAGLNAPADQQGLIPRLSEATFQRIIDLKTQTPDTKFEVKATMHEIYNDEVYDLLLPIPKKPPKDPTTRPKMKIQLGVPLDDNNDRGGMVVTDMDGIKSALTIGFTNQTKAPTGLNPDSSRGHTIFTLWIEMKYTVKVKKKKKLITQMKQLLLVDLAGSERGDKVAEITASQLRDIYQGKDWSQIPKEYWKTGNGASKMKAVTAFDGSVKMVNDMNKFSDDEQVEILTENGFSIRDKVTEKELAAYKAERAMEGKAINSSLSYLGAAVTKVGKAAAIQDKAKRKKKMNEISWRSNKLTLLLKEALSGKSKSVMIAAASPSATENPETESTMIYADNIGKIPSTAVATKKTVSKEELQAKQIEELKAQLAAFQAGGAVPAAGGGGGGGSGMTEAEAEEFEKARQQAEFEKEELLKEIEALKTATAAESGIESEEAKAQREAREKAAAAAQAALQAQVQLLQNAKNRPHISMLTMDPMSSGLRNDPIAPEGQNAIPLLICGNAEGENVVLELRGGGVKPNHCKLEEIGGKYFITQLAPDAQVFVNGAGIEAATEIFHNDRIRLASANYFRFIVPEVERQLDPVQQAEDMAKYTYEFVKNEALASITNGDQFKDPKIAERKAAIEAKVNDYKNKFAQDMEAIEDPIKAAEQKKGQDAFIKLLINTHEAEENANRLARERMSDDLRDVFPLVEQINHWASDLGLDTKYETKTQLVQRMSGLSFPQLVVELKDSKNRQEFWTMDEFTVKYAQLDTQYKQFTKDLARGRDLDVPPDSPFRVDAHADELIGTASTLWEFIYSLLGQDLEDFKIIGTETGEQAGSVTASTKILWANAEEEDESLDWESLHEYKSDYMDVEIYIEGCKNLPQNFSSNVVVSIPLPAHLKYALLPLDFDRSQRLDEKQRKEWQRQGGELTSQIREKHRDKASPNPKIKARWILRILDMSFRVREWFQVGKLMFIVRGEPPKIIVNTSALAAEERARREEKMKATGGISRTKTIANQLTLLEADKEDLEDSVKHYKDELKQRDAELAALKKQLAAANSRVSGPAPAAAAASGDTNAQLEELTRQLAQARKEAADNKRALEQEQAKPKSSSCSMM
jgi:hypothetical protein